jgi:hypothetical protein
MEHQAAGPVFVVLQSNKPSHRAALVIDLHPKHGGRGGLLLWRSFTDNGAHVFKQHGHSLQLALS